MFHNVQIYHKNYFKPQCTHISLEKNRRLTTWGPATPLCLNIKENTATISPFFHIFTFSSYNVPQKPSLPYLTFIYESYQPTSGA